MELLIRGGTLVGPEGMYRADIAVAAGKIERIGRALQPEPGARVVDARGRWVLPGAVDGHVHLALPSAGTMSSDDYYTGTRAAACGGTTTVIDFIQQEPGERLTDVLARRKALAAGECCVDYAFHIGISDVGTPGALESMADAIAQGVSSFKAYMVYGFGVDDGALFRILEASERFGGLVGVHAENRAVLEVLAGRFKAEGKTGPWWHYKSRDELVEGEAVARAIALAKMAGAPLYIAHLASEEGVEAVARARRAGQRVFAETCPQYLNFTNEVYRGERGCDYVCSPPMKGRASRDALWRAIERGEIDTVATDHCPFMRGEKDWGVALPDGTPGDFSTIPNGLGGVEVMYAYMLSCAVKGRIAVSRAVELCCGNPARLFGLEERKGALRVGLDADIVLFDPRGRVTVRNERLHGACDYSVWEGVPLRGRVTGVYSRGKLVCDEGRFLGTQGDGHYLKCHPLRFTAPRL